MGIIGTRCTVCKERDDKPKLLYNDPKGRPGHIHVHCLKKLMEEEE